MEVNGRKLLAAGAGLAVSVLFVWFLLSRLPLDRLLRSLADLPLSPAMAGLFFLALCANLLCRALLLKRFFKDHGLSLPWCTGAAALHNLMANTLPYSLGEGALLLLVRHRGVPLLHGLYGLLFLRLVEVPVRCLFLVAGLLGTHNALPHSRAIAWGLLAATGAFSLVLVRLARAKETPPGASSSRLGRLRDLAARSVPSDPAVYLLTAAKIATGYAFCALAINALGAGLGPLKASLFFGASSLFNYLPIQGVAGVGTMEAYVGASLMALGWPLDKALPMAVGYHALTYAGFAAATLVFLPGLFPARRGRPKQTG